MKRRLIAALIILLLAAAACGLYLLLYTPAGLQWTLRQAQAYVPGQLKIAHADGRLAGPLELTGLSYENDAVAVRADRMALSWHPGRLADRVLAVEALSVDGLDVTIKPSPASHSGGGFDAQLPLAIEMERLHAGPVTVRLAGREPEIIDRIDLNATARMGMMHVSELRVESRRLNIDASGDLPLNPREPLRLDVRWQGAVQQWTLAGTGTLGGTWRRPAAEMHLIQPLVLNVAAQLDTEKEPLGWSIRAAADPFSPSALLPQAPPGQVSGAAIDASGTGTTFNGSGGLTWEDERYGRWTIALNADWDGARWDFPRIELKAADGPTQISGRGQITPVEGGPPRFLVETRWRDLVWPLHPAGRVLSPNGTLSVQGTAAQYSFDVTGLLLPPEVPPLKLRLAGRGDLAHLDIERLASDWLGGEWSGRGVFAWSPAPGWDLVLSPRHANPAAFRNDLDGKLDADARIRGAYLDDKLLLDMDVDRLEGTLHGYPATARGRLAYRPGEFLVNDLELRSGAATLALNARFGAEWQIDWLLNAPDLGELYPGLAGTLRTQGRLDGPPATPRIRLELDAGQAVYQSVYAGSLQVRADVDTRPEGQWQVSARAADAGTPTLHRAGMTLDVTGNSADHALRLTAEQGGYRLEQQLRGSLRERRWEAQLHDGRLELATLGAYTQQGTSALTLAADTVAWQPWCWKREAASVCLDASGDPAAGLQANLNWRELDISGLAALAPDSGITLQGNAAGEAHVVLMAGALQSLSAQLELGAGAIGYPLPAGIAQQGTIHYREIGMQLAGSGDTGLHANIHADIDDSARFSADLQLPQWDPASPAAAGQALRGQGEFSLGNLGAISLIVPAVQPGPGRLQGTLALSGTLAEPLVDGQVDLQLSTLTVASLGLTLQNLKLQAQAVQNRWKLQGALQSGTGQLTFDGSGMLQDAQHWQAAVSLNGDKVEIVRLPGFLLNASPAMTLTLLPGDLEIAGKLTIPEAQLEPVIKQSGTAVSQDVVVSGREEDARSPQTHVHGSLDLVLGDAVKLTAMGVKGRLTGHVQVLMAGTDDIRGHGEIRLVDSRFQAYGQDLTIERGSILYAGGPIDNPALNIVASRMRQQDIQDIKVGVRVTGTAEQPVLTLFSDPPMDESDILSYLVIGRPLNEASKSEGESLYKEAATSISLAGSGAIASRIGGIFDLNEVNIESGQTSADTALVLGKSLSPRLYLRYVQSLEENTTTFQIRYRLNKTWTVQTESGSVSGADLIYTLER